MSEPSLSAATKSKYETSCASPSESTKYKKAAKDLIAAAYFTPEDLNQISVAIEKVSGSSPVCAQIWIRELCHIAYPYLPKDPKSCLEKYTFPADPEAHGKAVKAYHDRRSNVRAGISQNALFSDLRESLLGAIEYLSNADSSPETSMALQELITNLRRVHKLARVAKELAKNPDSIVSLSNGESAELNHFVLLPAPLALQAVLRDSVGGVGGYKGSIPSLPRDIVGRLLGGRPDAAREYIDKGLLSWFRTLLKNPKVFNVAPSLDDYNPDGAAIIEAIRIASMYKLGSTLTFLKDLGPIICERFKVIGLSVQAGLHIEHWELEPQRSNLAPTLEQLFPRRSEALAPVVQARINKVPSRPLRNRNRHSKGDFEVRYDALESRCAGNFAYVAAHIEKQMDTLIAEIPRLKELGFENTIRLVRSVVAISSEQNFKTVAIPQKELAGDNRRIIENNETGVASTIELLRTHKERAAASVRSMGQQTEEVAEVMHPKGTAYNFAVYMEQLAYYAANKAIKGDAIPIGMDRLFGNLYFVPQSDSDPSQTLLRLISESQSYVRDDLKCNREWCAALPRFLERYDIERVDRSLKTFLQETLAPCFDVTDNRLSSNYGVLAEEIAWGVITAAYYQAPETLRYLRELPGTFSELLKRCGVLGEVETLIFLRPWQLFTRTLADLFPETWSELAQNKTLAARLH